MSEASPSASPILAPATPPAAAPPVASASLGGAPVLSRGTRLRILLRMLAIQGSWNYEILVGNGIGFCIEPALRTLPGGRGGAAYRDALARQSAYFNAHPYLAALAVGALARAECDLVPPSRIERFRTALCGPLGSVGDRLVWAAWLPACSLVGLLLFGLHGTPQAVLLGFLLLYNAGHLWLRVWGLQAGWHQGLRVASAMGHPVLQHGPRYIGRGAAVCAGLALPLAVHRALGGGNPLGAIPVGVAVATPVLAVLLVRVRGRVEGWRVVLLVLVLCVLYSVLR